VMCRQRAADVTAFVAVEFARAVKGFVPMMQSI
jgi:hypothetical protein